MKSQTALPRVLIASGNPGKLREFGQMFADAGVEVAAQGDFSVPEAEETGLSFIENAIIKARNAARHSGLPALADDSGLAVDFLDGAPGIYSARYSLLEDSDAAQAIGADRASIDAANNRKLLQALDGVDDARRGARFICALAFMQHASDPVPLVCCGEWRGRILHRADGDGGFGYDPLFYVPELGSSSASLPTEIKNRHSHRGIALSQMRDALQQRGLLA